MNAYIVRTAKDKKEIDRFESLETALAAIEHYEERDEKAGTFTKWAYEVAYEGTWYSVADIDIRKNGEPGDEELLWIGDNEQEALEAFGSVTMSTTQLRRSAGFALRTGTT